MPELAEVEFFRRRWWEAGARETVCGAEAWAGSRVFRGLGKEFKGGAKGLAKLLVGARMVGSGTFGKQMWFVLEGSRDRGTKGQRGGEGRKSEVGRVKSEILNREGGREFQISDFKFQMGAGEELRIKKEELRKQASGREREFQGQAVVSRQETGADAEKKGFEICDLRIERGAQDNDVAKGDAQGNWIWLGVHLGMTGELRVEGADYVARKHDALILRMRECVLVFHDPRQFGRVRAWVEPEGAGRANSAGGSRELMKAGRGRTPRRGVPTVAKQNHGRPPWLRDLPAEILSDEFTPEFVRGVLARHGRAPLKAVLLNQRYFPGVGNWMADEILWRARLAPGLRAGRTATVKIARTLTVTIRRVTRDALRVIAGAGGKLPPDLNVLIPDTWLFNHRWRDGGVCPKTKQPLRREEIGGRTTCWSPAWQTKRE